MVKSFTKRENNGEKVSGVVCTLKLELGLVFSVYLCWGYHLGLLKDMRYILY